MAARSWAVLLVSALGGCAVGPNYRPPVISPPANFTSAAAAPAAATAVDPARWWHALGDPELDALIERAATANPDLQVALARLQQARTREIQLIGTALPALGASASGGNGTGSDLSKLGADAPLRAGDYRGGQPIREVAGFAGAWELDLFGGYRRAIEAGRYDVQAAEWARNAVLVRVFADVARAYVQYRGLEQRIAITERNIDAARELRDYEAERFGHGLTNELDLQLAERELGSLQAALSPLRSAAAAAQFHIAVLLGEFPEQLGVELTRPGLLPTVPSALEAGLPPELLRRRPDVREAERELAAATARIGVAAADLFPHIGVSGGLGTQSTSLNAHGAHLWAFGPTLYWPLLDFGVLDAELGIAKYEAQARLAEYRRTVISAVEDADDAIARYRAAVDSTTALARAMRASERAVWLAQQRYERGLTDFLNVVDAERQAYDLEERFTEAQQGAAEGFVDVYRALGGGWEQHQQIAPIRVPLPALAAGVREMADRGRAP